MERSTVIILVVLWFVIVISNSLFLFINKDPRLKRRVTPWMMTVDGLVFMAFIFWLERARMNGWYVLNVFVTTFIITFYNMRASVFCDNCGFTLFRVWPIQQFKNCYNCGARCIHGAPRYSNLFCKKNT